MRPTVTPSGPPCSDTHCVTCSDEGIPMRVVEAADDGLAWCAEGSERREVMTGLVGAVKPGDILLVHAGTALTILSSQAGEAAP